MDNPCFSKIQIGFSFLWYRLTQVVPNKGPLNGCVCVSGDFSDISPESLDMFRHNVKWISGYFAYMDTHNQVPVLST